MSNISKPSKSTENPEVRKRDVVFDKVFDFVRNDIPLNLKVNALLKEVDSLVAKEKIGMLEQVNAIQFYARQLCGQILFKSGQQHYAIVQKSRLPPRQ